MLVADLIIEHARTLYTCAGPVPRRGRDQGDAGAVSDGAVASHAGTIVFAGPTPACRARVRPLPGARVLDATDHTVVPGFVDAHTHVLYAGDRREELARRLAGETYAAILAAGGGILATVRATRAAGEDALVAATRPRLEAMLRSGTTTAEVKSGYGLTLDDELKMLRAIRRLAAEQPIELVPTFLGAHEIPPEFRGRRERYVDLVIREMIPAVARERLAAWCDVFCEEGVFSPEESDAILRAGVRHGLGARLHADELAPSGGARVAAAVAARSADHLVHVTRDGIAALAAAGTVATLLPSAAFYLKLGRYAPARDLIAAGVPVALGTDVNPGGGLSSSMPFAMTLACFAMDLTAEEALVAATANAAYALDRHARVGRLEPGRQMDAVVLRGDLVDLLKVDAQPIACVVKRGVVVVER
jgi:imidazolonepropionase